MSNIDATAHLNHLLSVKPSLLVQGTEQYTKRVCGRYGGDVGDYDCVDIVATRVVLVNTPPAITNSRVVEVRSISFGAIVPSSIPESVIVTRKTIRNNADVSVTSSVNLTLTGTESLQFTKTNGVSTTVGASLSLSNIATPIGTGGVSLSVSQTISTSTATSEGSSRTVSRSTNDTVSIGPRKNIQYELMAYQSSANLPFHADIVVDGDLILNASGVSLASHLLSADERSFQVDGVIQISALSEAFLDVTELPQVSQISDPSRQLESTTESFKIHGVLSELMRTSFKPQAAWSRDQSTAVVIARAAPHSLLKPLAADDTGIGPPDGTHYEVLYTEKVYRPTPQCGFNDIGVMNGGIFRIEARRYTTYASGEVVASWEEKVEIFESCFEL
jgi:hypothetical protein